MADKKVSQMPAVVTLGGGDVVPVVQGGVNKRTTALDISRLSIPTGGTIGQALKKTASTNYAVAWADDNAGAGGGMTLYGITFDAVDDPDNIVNTTNNASAWTVTRNTTGQYTVTHNLGFASGQDYLVVASMRNIGVSSKGFVNITQQQPDHFEVSVYNVAGALVDGVFTVCVFMMAANQP